MLIKTENISKTYRMGEEIIYAIRNISLEIESGSFCAILGPSGSGKSTLMHILGCLDAPTQGSYSLEEKRVDRLSSPLLAEIRSRKIGFVFQTFNLLSRFNLFYNVELPLIYAGVPLRERIKKTKEVIGLVGLEVRIKHRPDELSGGERQRVAIARALVNNPAVILADEPTGNLDSHTGEQILNLFTSLNKKGRTIILVTHNREIAQRANFIFYLKDGQLTGKEET